MEIFTLKLSSRGLQLGRFFCGSAQIVEVKVVQG